MAVPEAGTERWGGFGATLSVGQAGHSAQAALRAVAYGGDGVVIAIPFLGCVPRCLLPLCVRL